MVCLSTWHVWSGNATQSKVCDKRFLIRFLVTFVILTAIEVLQSNTRQAGTVLSEVTRARLLNQFENETNAKKWPSACEHGLHASLASLCHTPVGCQALLCTPVTETWARGLCVLGWDVGAAGAEGQTDKANRTKRHDQKAGRSEARCSGRLSSFLYQREAPSGV